MLRCTFAAPGFWTWFHSDTFWYFRIFYFCFMSKKYFLILLNFTRYLSSCKHNFCIDEKCTQWNLNTKVKVFHESISCFMKCPERKISQCIHPLRIPLESCFWSLQFMSINSKFLRWKAAQFHKKIVLQNIRFWNEIFLFRAQNSACEACHWKCTP